MTRSHHHQHKVESGIIYIEIFYSDEGEMLVRQLCFSTIVPHFSFSIYKSNITHTADISLIQKVTRFGHVCIQPRHTNITKYGSLKVLEDSI